MPTRNQQKYQIRREKTQRNNLQKLLRTELDITHPPPNMMSKRSPHQTQNHELLKHKEWKYFKPPNYKEKQIIYTKPRVKKVKIIQTILGFSMTILVVREYFYKFSNANCQFWTLPKLSTRIRIGLRNGSVGKALPCKSGDLWSILTTSEGRCGCVCPESQHYPPIFYRKIGDSDGIIQQFEYQPAWSVLAQQ